MHDIEPDITPAAALYQIPASQGPAAFRNLRFLVQQHIRGRQLGFLGEQRVNVVELNLALDSTPR
jgi:K+-transporting ATPase ATPase C chain